MKKIVWTFGLIGGLIVVAMFIITFQAGEEMDFDTMEVVGYTTMIIALSTVFFGIKTYRDRHLGGSISFKKAFLTGLYITLVASVLYVTWWMIYSHFFMPDFMEKYSNHVIQEMRNDHVSQEKIDATIKQMEQWKELYKNPLVKFGMTLMEIFPLGLIITLISAAILKRKPKAEAAV